MLCLNGKFFEQINMWKVSYPMSDDMDQEDGGFIAVDKTLLKLSRAHAVIANPM